MRLEMPADTYLSVGTPVQVAAPGLLEAGQDVRLQIRQRVLQQLSRACSNGRRAGTRPVRCFAPRAAGRPCCASRTRCRRTSASIRLLERHHLLVHPGYFFDFPRDGYLVVSLLTRPDVFRGARASADGRLHLTANFSPLCVHDRLPGRSAGLVVPLFSLHSARSCGHRRHRRPAPLGRVAAARRSSRAAAAAGRHAAGRRDLAVLGAERHGDRPGVHQPGRRARLLALGGEVRLPLADQVALRRARSASAVRYDDVRQAKQSGAAPGVQPVLGRRLAPHHGARRRVCRVRLVGRVVAGRLRPLLRAAGTARATVPGPSGRRRFGNRQPERARGGAPRAGAGDPLSPVRAVARRRRSGKRRASRWARSGCLATFPFMVGADSADVWANQHAVPLRSHRRHAAGCVQRDRTGLGTAGLSLGRDGR